MSIKSIALASVATLAFVAPAFAGSGASVTNSDTYRNIYNGKSVTKGIIKSAKVEVKRGTSAAIKLEGEGSRINTTSYNNNYSNVDRDSDSYRNYYCSFFSGCRLSSYGYSNSYDTYSSNSNGYQTNAQSGGSIGVGAGNGQTAGVSGSTSGSTVIGAVSESSFSSVEVTKSLIGFKDSYQYNGYDRTHTVSTEAF